jgi:uncharacterized protein YgbK (DUF1537 family)
MFGSVADDLTGANDLGVMIARQDVPVRVLLDPWELPAPANAYPALIVEAGTRGDDPATAYARTREATRRLLEWGRRPLYKKMSSTFQGNIGVEIDAMLDEAGEDFTIVVPAFPENGRTTRRGIHYVHGVPIGETWLAHHPTSPVTESYLPAALQAQTQRRVGLIDETVIDQGVEVLRVALAEARRAYQMVVLDAAHQEHLETIARASEDLLVLSGGSALATALRYPAAPLPLPPQPRPGKVWRGGSLIVAGSVSDATRGQVAAALANGMSEELVRPAPVLAGRVEAATEVARVVEAATGRLQSGADVLVRTPAEVEEVKATLAAGAAAGLSEKAVGQALTAALSEITVRVVERTGLDRLVVAGGDTSAVICRRLGLLEHEILEEVQTGVPVSIGRGARTMLVVLKSGNFGDEHFFADAIAALERET